ncbi:MAG: TIGR00282 family metallophosphoesterase [Rhodospirillales bacterium]|nr:TIGR00282 family metallophosphoesterase [Rhodospirillales bacterium]
MRILYCGDIVGKPGRQVLQDNLPRLREELKLDFVMVNGENAAHGFGITAKICKEIYEEGADAITTGNHVWDQREILSYIETDPKLIRPLNYPAGTPGRGAQLYTTAKGRKVLVMQVLGRLFMDAMDDPFAAVDRELTKYRLGSTVDAILVDIHAEATSEKFSMGHFLDGRVSMVCGTHTHIPSADAQILPGGTAYQTDVGMCGNYNSVIGMKKEVAIARFTKKVPGNRLEPSEGEGTLCAFYLETDDRTGKATKVSPIRIGPRLIPIMPS